MTELKPKRAHRRTNALLILDELLKRGEVQEFTYGEMTVKFYPGVGGRQRDTNIDPEMPSPREAVRDAFEAAKLALEEDEINTYYST